MNKWTEVAVVCALAMMDGRMTAQTRIDLRTQAKSVDFSESSSTKPSKTGTALPSTCTVGETLFKSNAPAGQNLYGCTSTNTWTALAPVTSVLGRTGAVTAQTGDYSFAQITGTVGNTQLSAGIDAAKIGGAGVSNTVFGYLAGVTGDIQTQLSGKAAAGHNHVLAGDVTGQTSDVTVSRIQNRAVSALAPADGQALVWSGAANAWSPAAISGGGTGGATMGSGLGDLRVERSAATTLQIGAGCSAALPCNVRFGNLATRKTVGASVTVSAGTGDVYVYVISPGTLVVGHSGLTLSCNNCTAVSGVTAFPADSLPLWQWRAANGSWEASGQDFRAFLSAKTVQAGTGLLTLDAGGQTTVAVDSAVVGLRVAPPGGESTACETGQWATDVNYKYLCIAPNAWRRVPLPLWGQESTGEGGGTTLIQYSGLGLIWPWGPPILENASGVQVSPGPNWVKLDQFTLTVKAVIGRIAFQVETADADKGLRFAIYNSGCNAILAQTGALTTGYTDAAASRIASFSSAVTLDPGVYYLAATSDSSGILKLKGITTDWAFATLENQFGSLHGRAGNNSTGSGASLALPAACGTIATESSGFTIPLRAALGR